MILSFNLLEIFFIKNNKSHRGFETVTYCLDGEAEHEDFLGNYGKLKPGCC